MTVQGNNYTLGGGLTATLNPGIYNGGITLANGCTATLNPGIYYLNGGGFILAGGSKCTGSGVMFYNTGGGSFNISNGTTLNLSPPTSGTYQGVTFFQDRTSNATVVLCGGSTSTVAGAIYAPDATINISNGISLNSIASQIIAYDMTNTGGASVVINTSSSTLPATRPLRAGRVCRLLRGVTRIQQA